MAYVKELDDLRREIRLGESSTVTFWPKIAGTGNVAIDAGTGTFTVHQPDGTQIQSSTAITESDQGGYDSLPCVVSAINTLDEGYQIRVTYDVNSVTYRDIILADIVQWPYSYGGHGSISLNDLLEERPDIERVLDRHAIKFASATTEVAASIYGYRARVHSDMLIRQRIRLDSTTAPDAESAGSLSGSRFTRPALILNRGQFNMFERYIALMLIFEADAKDPEEGTSESDALYRHYLKRSSDTLSMLHTEYDSGEDLEVDTVLTDAGRVATLRRSY